jgi:hypothetical protein
MLFAKDQDMIQAVTPQRPDQALSLPEIKSERIDGATRGSNHICQRVTPHL